MINIMSGCQYNLEDNKNSFTFSSDAFENNFKSHATELLLLYQAYQSGQKMLNKHSVVSNHLRLPRKKLYCK